MPLHLLFDGELKYNVPMSWTQQVEYIEEVPLAVRKTPKTYWDHDSNSWKNTNIWTIEHRLPIEAWLKEHYPSERKSGPLGWYTAMGNITMGEKIYLHYCLAAKHD